MASRDEDRIAALEAALASGELTVEFADTRVTYRSTDELLRALGYFRAKRAEAAGRGPVRVSIGAFARG